MAGERSQLFWKQDGGKQAENTEKLKGLTYERNVMGYRGDSGAEWWGGGGGSGWGGGGVSFMVAAGKEKDKSNN